MGLAFLGRVSFYSFVLQRLEEKVNQFQGRNFLRHPAGSTSYIFLKELNSRLAEWTF